MRSCCGLSGFSATEAMLEDTAALDAAMDAFRPEVIIHLAAQAGVRYSLENPRSYVQSNVVGTFNVMEAARRLGVRASADGLDQFGLWRERGDALPRDRQGRRSSLTIYAATKKAGEAMGHSYAHLWNLPTTMFRFFTVYGPWGRPDMALFKFTDAILEGPADRHLQPWRDVARLHLCRRSGRGHPPSDRCAAAAPGRRAAGRARRQPVEGRPLPHRQHRQFRPVRLLDFVEVPWKRCWGKAIRNYMPMQKGDVPATWADATLLQRLTGYRPQDRPAPGGAGFRRMASRLLPRLIWC
jgi:UDP-glucuronate 4-epimerase